MRSVVSIGHFRAFYVIFVPLEFDCSDYTIKVYYIDFCLSTHGENSVIFYFDKSAYVQVVTDCQYFVSDDVMHQSELTTFNHEHTSDPVIMIVSSH